MDLDITDFVATCDPYQFSASRAEMGVDASRITWRNAKDEARLGPLLTTAEQIEEARDWLGSFGAWARDELAQMDEVEINALVIQFISGNLREIETLCSGDDGEIDWDEVERLEQVGTIAGSISHSDDGRVYFYLGS